MKLLKIFKACLIAVIPVLCCLLWFLLTLGRNNTWYAEKNYIKDEVLQFEEERGLPYKSPSNSSLSAAKDREIAFSLLELKTPSYLPSSVYKNPCWLDGPGENLMCVPYVFLAGFPKCGTTDLYSRLVAHPLVSAANNKEPMFWSWGVYHKYMKCLAETALNNSTSCLIRLYSSSQFSLPAADIQRNAKWAETDTTGLEAIAARRRYDRPVTDDVAIVKRMWHRLKLDWLRLREKEMEKIPHPMITVDGSTGYSWNESSWRMIQENEDRVEPVVLNPDVIYKVNPQAKIILIMRDPVARAYSYYKALRKNRNPDQFHDWVVTFIQKFDNCLKSSSVRVCTFDARERGALTVDLEAGIYHIHLTEWLRRFPRENFLFLRTETYNQDVKGTLEQIYKFLDLPLLSQAAMDAIGQLSKKNAAPKRIARLRPMWPETRDILTKFYAEHNRKLADLLADERFTWQDVSN